MKATIVEMRSKMKISRKRQETPNWKVKTITYKVSISLLITFVFISFGTFFIKDTML